MKLWNTLFYERKVLKQFDEVNYLNKKIPPVFSMLLTVLEVMRPIFVLLDAHLDLILAAASTLVFP